MIVTKSRDVSFVRTRNFHSLFGVIFSQNRRSNSFLFSASVVKCEADKNSFLAAKSSARASRCEGVIKSLDACCVLLFRAICFASASKSLICFSMTPEIDLSIYAFYRCESQSLARFARLIDCESLPRNSERSDSIKTAVCRNREIKRSTA